jgi:hypothetical protein
MEAEMAGPCKQNGRSQKAKESAAGMPGGGRKRGKPRKKWLDDVEDNLRKTGFKRWTINAICRTEWRKIREAAKVLKS